MYASNLKRSAKAPVQRSGVIVANLFWKEAKSTPGMVGALGSEAVQPTPARNGWLSAPVGAGQSGEKAPWDSKGG